MELFDTYLSSDPKGCRFKMIGNGILLSFLAIAYGAWCILSGEATLPSPRGPGLVIKGIPLYTHAFAILLFGCSIHFHYFWGNSRNKTLEMYYQPLKILSFAAAAMLYVVTLGYILIAM